MNVICTSEEGVSALIPVGKGVFRRLFTLQNEMVNTLPQNCALDPREFRMLKTNAKRRCGRPDKKKWKKSFLDAFVPCRFLHLAMWRRRSLHAASKSKPDSHKLPQFYHYPSAAATRRY
ncbi:uncharacterized protein PITG_20014 [Phytophthora infestans T30-4]|uniref:RSE1/DDB1/CPSF1 C-terminal domain-containing protein n=1 Tax=Phytophthora infestans (strain T30-4) TaxID=403677 RepID=D0P178_PHYIT|nr:uncharacterized protein PITG_20014 [Phytophthora infestans T30-4]EEY54101.1 conserved hypothetical protein [Phytophthora infestans T30-4]|eukprot:XP_002895953.1 conserved hypothetical protein [Phytophthora infestans T30-4]